MERRITGTVGTIPKDTALVGVVNSQTDPTKFIYTGSDDVANIYTKSTTSSVDSPSWIWVHGVGAPYLARVIGIYKNGTANYTLYLDRSFAGCVNAACSYVPAPVSFGFVNDGGTTGKVCSGDQGSALINILNDEGDSNKAYQLYSQHIKLQTPLYVDATGTDFLINEETPNKH